MPGPQLGTFSWARGLRGWGGEEEERKRRGRGEQEEGKGKRGYI